MRKAYGIVNKAFSINFFTSYGQYKNPDTAYHDPLLLLKEAYKLTNSVILDNSCFPYEATLTIFKDDSSNEFHNIYDHYLREHKKEFDDGTFVIKQK